MTTLRKRLITSYVLVALVGVLLASVIGAWLVYRGQVRTAEQTTALIANVVGARARARGIAPDDAALLQLVEAAGGRLLAVQPNGVVRFDSAGEVEGQRLPGWRVLLRDESTILRDRLVRRGRLDGQGYFFSVLPARPAQGGPWLVIGLPSATLIGSWLRLLPTVLVLSGLGAVVAGLLGWRVSRQLAEPVEALTVAADGMAEGDYDSRVDTISEIEELSTLARSFNMMASEVRQARQTQRDFLANVSHDLRTPLTSIQGFSQALMDGAVPEEQTSRVAGIIHTEAARLSRLVQDLLDLARIEAGRFSMVQRDIDMQTVLQRCSDKFQHQAESMNVTFDTRLPRTALPVHGDADRLEQVVTNLIDNALTYAQGGGGHVRLMGALGGIRGSRARTAGQNGHSQANDDADASKNLGRWWIEVKVEDDGPGIDDEQKPLVFERFYRSDRSRGGTGLGLGLAIAREIVEAHGGDIAIYDGEPQGTQFVVRLPMKMK